MMKMMMMMMIVMMMTMMMMMVTTDVDSNHFVLITVPTLILHMLILIMRDHKYIN